MTGKRLFLEQSRLIENIASIFNLNEKGDVPQRDRRSIESVYEKESKDCHNLVRTISFLICHNDEEKYSECKCKECLTLSKILSRHCQRCLSLYRYIVKKNIETSIEPERVKGAILDFFILPYLMRVVNELKVKFNDSRFLWYLDKYIKFVVFDAPSSEPILESFLREHVASVPCNLYVDETRYRVKKKRGKKEVEYQPWGSFINTAEEQIKSSKEKGVPRSSTIKTVKVKAKERVEASRWHYVGYVLCQLLKLIYPPSKEHTLCRNSNIPSKLRKKYDFLYSYSLSLNGDMEFSLLRSDEVKLNLKVNHRVACSLSIDKKIFGRKHIVKSAQFGLSFDKDTLFRLSLKHENKSLSDKEAEFEIVPRDDAAITFFIDRDGQFNLLFHKSAIFGLYPNKRDHSNFSFFSFESCRDHWHKNIGDVITAFEQAVSRPENKDISLTEIEAIDPFCEVVLNGVPAMEDIKKEEDKLRALLKEGQITRYISFFAWCIFIAKCKHNKIKAGNEIKYCESKLLEYQEDYNNEIFNFKGILKNRAVYADFKDEMLLRLGYIRIYNRLIMGDFQQCPKVLQFINKKRYTGGIIHPFTAIEIQIDKWLKWTDCSSSKVIIDVPAIKRSRKKFETSLSWLVMFNNKINPEDDEKKMKLCMTCVVILYPELMTLAGLTPIDKFKCMMNQGHIKTYPNPIINDLAVHLGPCQCIEVNNLKLAENNIKNNESECLLGQGHSLPIRIR